MDLSRRELLATATALPLIASAGAGPAAAIDPAVLSPRRYRAASKRISLPMRDGVALMATLVHPADAPADARFPVVLTYDPYRRSEGDGLGMFGFFAEHGYFGVLLDVRGTGGSAGRTTPNQYSVQEQEDALDAIAWLAAQPWCNGNVGMQGTSYGGFNAIQIAMLQPPALKAIIPCFATDDVFTDDIAYYDGALQGESLGRWPFSMIATMGLPGPPDYDPEGPEARYRVEHEPWVFEMLRHQANDAFWQRQSLRPDYSRIKVPVLSIAGWLDAYTDSTPRLLEKLDVPCRAIIGPWTHGMGLPGPAIDIDLERLRWWDQWLKGLDTGVLAEPKIALYVNHSYKPSLTLGDVPGHWRYETQWPPGRVRDMVLYPQPGERLLPRPSKPLERDLAYKPTVGMTNRYRCPHNSAELPVDQRPDDDFSLCFDTAPLDAELELLGFPAVELFVSATAPVATWVARLCDVAPDGTSTLVTKGILNGCHRKSHVTPEALVPGEIYRLAFDLKAISWVFPKGHRIRLAIGNADFPNLWPSPYPMTTSLHAGKGRWSRLMLPVCAKAPEKAPAFTPPPEPPGPRRQPVNQWTVTRDEMARSVTVFRETANPVDAAGSGGFERRWMTVKDDDPARTVLRAEGRAERRRGTDALAVDTAMTIASDEASFHITASRKLLVNGAVKYQAAWEDRIARRFT